MVSILMYRYLHHHGVVAKICFVKITRKPPSSEKSQEVLSAGLMILIHRISLKTINNNYLHLNRPDLGQSEKLKDKGKSECLRPPGRVGGRQLCLIYETRGLEGEP